MEPSKYPTLNLHNFGAGGETVVSPLVLVGVFLAGLAILSLPRKYVIWAFLFPAVFIPLGQVVMVAGLHIRMMRVITIVGLARLVISSLRRAEKPIERNSLDRVFVFWAVSYFAIFTLRWQTSGALINQLGGLFDSLAIYWVVRYLIRDEDDVLRTIRVFAMICCVVAIFMVMESRSGHNPLSVLGGVRELSEVRNGSVRAQGPFGHAILAGVFGATAIPLFVGLWVRSRKDRTYAIVGTVAALTMGVTCASSTGLMAIAGAVGAFSLWPIRKNMRLVRRGIVATLVGLEIVMKADVWWLIARVDLTGGSTSWDRASLIDNAIKHFSEWWLLGTNDNGNWGFSMYDLCVQYVAQGVQGGLLTLVLFFAIITLCFKRIGQARKAAVGNFRKEFFIWAVGATLFGHVCSFFGSSYWDQNVISWYVLLVVISAVATSTFRHSSRELRERPLASPQESSLSSQASTVPVGEALCDARRPFQPEPIRL